MCGFETWFLVVREEDKLSACRVLGRLFRSNRGKVTGGWRKLYNEELHKFYSSTNVTSMIKSIKINGHVAHMRRDENFVQNFGLEI